MLKKLKKHLQKWLLKDLEKDIANFKYDFTKVQNEVGKYKNADLFGKVIRMEIERQKEHDLLIDKVRKVLNGYEFDKRINDNMEWINKIVDIGLYIENKQKALERHLKISIVGDKRTKVGFKYINNK